MQTFTIKRGDTSPAILYALFPETISLAAATILFKMSGQSGGLKVNAPAYVSQSSPPVVGYQWQAEDLDTAGNFLAEFEVTYGDGSVETFPNDEYIRIKVLSDL